MYLISYRLVTYSEPVQKETHQGIVKNSVRVNREYNVSRLRREINKRGPMIVISGYWLKMVKWQNSSYHAGTTTHVSISRINISKYRLGTRITRMPFQTVLIGSCKQISIVQTKPVQFTTFRCGTQLENASNIPDVTHNFRTGSHTPRGHARILTVFSNIFDMDPHSTMPTLKDFHTLSTLNSENVSIVQEKTIYFHIILYTAFEWNHVNKTKEFPSFFDSVIQKYLSSANNRNYFQEIP